MKQFRKLLAGFLGLTLAVSTLPAYAMRDEQKLEGKRAGLQEIEEALQTGNPGVALQVASAGLEQFAQRFASPPSQLPPPSPSARTAGLEATYVLSHDEGRGPRVFESKSRQDPGPKEFLAHPGDVFRIVIPHSSRNFFEADERVFLVQINPDGKSFSTLEKRTGDFEEQEGTSYFEMTLRRSWREGSQTAEVSPLPLSGPSGDPLQVSLLAGKLILRYSKKTPSFAADEVHPLGPVEVWANDWGPWGTGAGLEETVAILADGRKVVSEPDGLSLLDVSGEPLEKVAGFAPLGPAEELADGTLLVPAGWKEGDQDKNGLVFASFQEKRLGRPAENPGILSRFETAEPPIGVELLPGKQVRVSFASGSKTYTLTTAKQLVEVVPPSVAAERKFGYSIDQAKETVEKAAAAYGLTVAWEEPVPVRGSFRTDLEAVARSPQAGADTPGVRISLISAVDTAGKLANSFNMDVTDERLDSSNPARVAHYQTTQAGEVVRYLRQLLATAQVERMFERHAPADVKPWQRILPRGDVPPLLTPFIEGPAGVLEVDRASARRHHAMLKQMGVQAGFAVGTTGEFHTMSADLKRQAIQILTEEMKAAGLIAWVNITGNLGPQGQLPTQEEALDQLVENAKIARDAGADLLVVVPLYYLDSEEKVVPHFQRLRERLDQERIYLPLGLYNIAMLQGGKNLTPATVAALKRDRLIAVVKDTSLNSDLTASFIATGVTVYTGNDPEPIKDLDNGAQGVVGFAANYQKADVELPTAPADRRPGFLTEVQRFFPIVAGPWDSLHLQRGGKYVLTQLRDENGQPIFATDLVADPSKMPPLSAAKKVEIDAVVHRFGPNPRFVDKVIIGLGTDLNQLLTVDGALTHPLHPGIEYGIDAIEGNAIKTTIYRLDGSGKRIGTIGQKVLPKTVEPPKPFVSDSLSGYTYYSPPAGGLEERWREAPPVTLRKFPRKDSRLALTNFNGSNDRLVVRFDRTERNKAILGFRALNSDGQQVSNVFAIVTANELEHILMNVLQGATIPRDVRGRLMLDVLQNPNVRRVIQSLQEQTTTAPQSERVLSFGGERVILVSTGGEDGTKWYPFAELTITVRPKDYSNRVLIRPSVLEPVGVYRESVLTSAAGLEEDLGFKHLLVVITNPQIKDLVISHVRQFVADRARVSFIDDLEQVASHVRVSGMQRGQAVDAILVVSHAARLRNLGAIIRNAQRPTVVLTSHITSSHITAALADLRQANLLRLDAAINWKNREIEIPSTIPLLLRRFKPTIETKPVPPGGLEENQANRQVGGWNRREVLRLAGLGVAAATANSLGIPPTELSAQEAASPQRALAALAEAFGPDRFGVTPVAWGDTSEFLKMPDFFDHVVQAHMRTTFISSQFVDLPQEDQQKIIDQVKKAKLSTLGFLLGNPDWVLKEKREKVEARIRQLMAALMKLDLDKELRVTFAFNMEPYSKRIDPDSGRPWREVTGWNGDLAGYSTVLSDVIVPTVEEISREAAERFGRAVVHKHSVVTFEPHWWVNGHVTDDGLTIRNLRHPEGKVVIAGMTYQPNARRIRSVGDRILTRAGESGNRSMFGADAKPGGDPNFYGQEDQIPVVLLETHRGLPKDVEPSVEGHFINFGSVGDVPGNRQAYKVIREVFLAQEVKVPEKITPEMKGGFGVKGNKLDEWVKAGDPLPHRVKATVTVPERWKGYKLVAVLVRETDVFYVQKNGGSWQNAYRDIDPSTGVVTLESDRPLIGEKAKARAFVILLKEHAAPFRDLYNDGKADGARKATERYGLQVVAISDEGNTKFSTELPPAAGLEGKGELPRQIQVTPEQVELDHAQDQAAYHRIIGESDPHWEGRVGALAENQNENIADRLSAGGLEEQILEETNGPALSRRQFFAQTPAAIIGSAAPLLGLASQPPSSPQEEQVARWRRQRWWTGILVGTTAAAAVTTGVLVVRHRLLWGSTNRALRRFKDSERRELRVEIQQMVRRTFWLTPFGERQWFLNILLPILIDQSPAPSDLQRNLRALELSLSRSPYRMYGLSDLIRGLPSEQLTLALNFAERLERNGVRASNALRVLPKTASLLTSEQFSLALETAEHLAQHRVSPAAFLEHTIPAIARASPTAEAYRTNLHAVEEALIRLRQALPFLGKGIPNPFSVSEWSEGPDPVLEYVVPAIVESSPTPERLDANILEFERFYLRYWAGVRQHPPLFPSWWMGGGRDPLHQYALPAIARGSSSPAAFRANLEILENRLRHWADRKGFAGSLLQHGIPAAIKIDSTPRLFEENLGVLEDFLSRLSQRQVDPESILASGLPALAQAGGTTLSFRENLRTLEQFILQLISEGSARLFDFRLSPDVVSPADPEGFKAVLTVLSRLRELRSLEWNKVTSDQVSALAGEAVRLQAQGTGYQLEVIPERGHTEQQQAYYGYGEVGPSVVDVYVMDSPQKIRLIPGGDLPVLVTRSPSLGQFLQGSGVLEAAATSYYDVLFHHGDARTTILYKPELPGAEFDVEGIGILPGYYPMTALGQKVVLRLYGEGRERTLAPVRTILVQGKVEGYYAHWKMRYELFPREEFEAMIAPDGLTHWTVNLPASGTAQAMQTPVSDDLTRENLQARNWNWRALAHGSGEISQDDALARIQGLKERVPWLEQALQEAGVSISSAVSLYALGSSVWGKVPRDLDLVVVEAGDEPYEVLEPRQIEGFGRPIHVQVVGAKTLKRALEGETVENQHALRGIHGLILYGSAVLIAGHDLFSGSRLPIENLGSLVAYFHQEAAFLRGAAGATGEGAFSKAERLDREADAVDRFAAEQKPEEAGPATKPAGGLEEMSRRGFLAVAASLAVTLYEGLFEVKNGKADALADNSVAGALNAEEGAHLTLKAKVDSAASRPVRILVQKGAVVPAAFEGIPTVELSDKPEVAQRELREQAREGDVALMAPKVIEAADTWNNLLRHYKVTGLLFTQRALIDLRGLQSEALNTFFATIQNAGGLIQITGVTEKNIRNERTLFIWA